MELALRNVTPKKHKETKKACFSFKSIIFIKKTYFAFTLAQWQDSDQEKK